MYSITLHHDKDPGVEAQKKFRFMTKNRHFLSQDTCNLQSSVFLHLIVSIKIPGTLFLDISLGAEIQPPEHEQF